MCVCVLFFLLFRVFALWAIAFFVLFGRGRGPCPNSTQKKRKKNKHPPSPPRPFPHLSTAEFDFQQQTPSRPNSVVWASSVFFLMFEHVCFFVFFSVWAGGACFFVCCLGGVCVFVSAVWAGSCFCFCCLGRVRVDFWLFGQGASFFVCCLGGQLFFFCLGGGRSSLTYRSAWLVFKGPNNKKNKQRKKKNAPDLRLRVYTTNLQIWNLQIWSTPSPKYIRA